MAGHDRQRKHRHEPERRERKREVRKGPTIWLTEKNIDVRKRKKRNRDRRARPEMCKTWCVFISLCSEIVKTHTMFSPFLLFDFHDFLMKT